MSPKFFTPVVVLGLCCASLLSHQKVHAAPPLGPAVLLRSGQVMFGTAREDGDQVIIESDHSMIRMPKRSVACWGDSLASLYQYRKDRRPPNSMQHHLDDAKWCLENGMLDDAKKELDKARKIGGVTPDSESLKRRIALAKEREAENEKLAANRVEQVSGISGTNDPVKQAEHLPPQLFSSTSVQRFTSHIQPIMINRCATAGCHGSRPAASPQLEGWRFGTTATITNRNLQEVGRLIDARSPLESRLWKMATTPHGKTTALSGGADQQLRDRLQEWLMIVCGQTNVGSVGAAPQYVPLAPAMNITPGSYVASPMTPVLVPETATPTTPELRASAPSSSTPPRNSPRSRIHLIQRSSIARIDSARKKVVTSIEATTQIKPATRKIKLRLPSLKNLSPQRVSG